MTKKHATVTAAVEIFMEPSTRFTKITANHRADNLNVPGCQPIIFFPDELGLKKRPALL